MTAPPHSPPALVGGLPPRRLHPERPALARYGWSAAVWVAALALTLALAPYVQRANFVFFWVAVLFAAWFGGIGPALLAALAAILAVDYFLIPPLHDFGLPERAEFLTFGIFAFASFTVSTLTAQLSRTQRRTTQDAHELATLAERLQEQAVELEQQMEEAQALAEELEETNEQLATANHDLEDAKSVAEAGREAAERERARLRAVLESLPDAAWVYDHEWRYVYINPAAEATVRATGLDPASLIGRVVWDVFPAAVGTKIHSETLRAVAEGRPVEFEEYSPPPFGRWFENQVVPSPAGTVTYSRDVTARRRADLAQRLLADAGALLASSLDYRATVQRVAELAVPALADWCGVDLLDEATGRLEQLAVAHVDPARVEWARELRRRYPPLPDSPRGTPMVVRTGRAEFYPVVTDEMIQAAARDEEHLRLIRQVGFHSVVTVPLTARGRTLGALTLVWAESQRQYDDADVALAQELARRAAVAIDTARLFEAEREARRTAERLQALTAALSEAATPAGVGDVVLEHGVRALGAQCGVVALLTPDATALEIVASAGYPPEACMGPGRRWPAGAAMPIAEATRTGEPVFVESIEAWGARYRSGHVPPRQRNAAWAALPLAGGASQGGAHGALLWTFDDAHTFGEGERALMATVARLCAQALERARLYEAERGARQEAEVARSQAEAANRTKGEFLATMSHELRTPINAALGYTDLLALGVHGPVTEAQREDLARLRRSQQRLLSLVNDVLNFARLESGRVDLEIADVPVDGVLARIEELVEPQVREKGLTYDYQRGEPALVARADRERFEQILLNLLSNAVKFTAPGGRVTVRAEADGGNVLVRVADTGRGIAPDQLEAIFEPFVQVERGLTRSADGIGLGLAISRELAQVMDGSLTAESTLGAGSTFTLALPHAGVAGPSDSPLSTEPAAANATSGQKPAT